MPVDQSDGDPGCTSASSPTDAVDVCLLVVGAAVVDDVGDAVDVDAASRNVGRHQDVDLAVAKRSHRLLTRTLTEVAVHRTDGETTAS